LGRDEIVGRDQVLSAVEHAVTNKPGNACQNQEDKHRTENAAATKLAVPDGGAMTCFHQCFCMEGEGEVGGGLVIEPSTESQVSLRLWPGSQRFPSAHRGRPRMEDARKT